jgi:hypothetical protein
MGHRIGARRGGFAVEADVVRVNVDHHQTAVLRHPIELAQPDRRGAFLEDEEEGRVLGEGVGELDVAGAAGAFRGAHPERKDGAGAVGLGLEGVRVEGRGVVADLKLVVPVEVAEHKPGAEALGGPVTQVAVNAPGFGRELSRRGE